MLLLFSAIGRYSHGFSVFDFETFKTADPFIAGSKDGTVRIWEVETGWCLWIWDLGDAIEEVAWNPLPALLILAVAVGYNVFLLNARVGNDEQENIETFLHFEPQKATDDNDISASMVHWSQDDKHGRIMLKHFKAVTKVEWHRKVGFFWHGQLK